MAKPSECQIIMFIINQKQETMLTSYIYIYI